MIGPAALSLHIARFLQSDPNVPMSPARWSLFPRLDKLTFTAACAALDSLAKPILFAPLIEPGSIFVTSADELVGDVRDVWLSHHRNQTVNVDPFLQRYGAVASDVLAFGRVNDVIETRVEVLREWTRDYLMSAPITFHSDPVRRGTHWLVVRRGHQEWSHGLVCKIVS
jgi:hypothetical protein